MYWACKRHGPHQVAQSSATTTRPRKSGGPSSRPSRVGRSKLGRARAHRWPTARRPATPPATRRPGRSRRRRPRPPPPLRRRSIRRAARAPNPGGARRAERDGCVVLLAPGRALQFFLPPSAPHDLGAAVLAVADLPAEFRQAVTDAVGGGPVLGGARLAAQLGDQLQQLAGPVVRLGTGTESLGAQPEDPAQADDGVGDEPAVGGGPRIPGPRSPCRR